MNKHALGVGMVALVAAISLTVGACAKMPRLDYSIRMMRHTPTPTENGNPEKTPGPEPDPTPEKVVPRIEPEWSPVDRGTSETRFESLAPLEA